MGPMGPGLGPATAIGSCGGAVVLLFGNTRPLAVGDDRFQHPISLLVSYDPLRTLRHRLPRSRRAFALIIVRTRMLRVAPDAFFDCRRDRLRARMLQDVLGVR